jgi:hypothetical protein
MHRSRHSCIPQTQAHRIPCPGHGSPQISPRKPLTFHEALLDNLTQPLHVGLGQVLARLGLLQPFVGSRTLGEAGGPRLGDVAFFGRHISGARGQQRMWGVTVTVVDAATGGTQRLGRVTVGW